MLTTTEARRTNDMARDLILGRTSRDWSCGRAVEVPVPERPWDRLPEAATLAEAVRALMSRTATSAIRSRRAGRLPEADWRGFGQLHRKWVALSDSRRERWRETDALLLWNLRESCEAFARKLAALEALARPPGALVPASPPPATPSSGPWYVALGAALALVGVGIYSNSKGR
jgi:hypothetical protein